MEITLEQEFAENLQMHKWAILVGKISKFYQDKIIADGTFLNQEEIEKKARIQARDEVRNLMLTDKAEFDRLYNIAWEEMQDEVQ
ncbi:MAG: hypothetical protein IKU37_08630 [Candidatus Gastranaerophilales bacterium]|nr:hypothetical protein [Candidatus Gastranaerophilales bacterium]